MDVNVVASVSGGGTQTLETRLHDCSVVNINDNAGAFIQIETAAALANAISKMKVSCTFGEPIQIRKGANAAAALAGTDLALLNQGQTADFDVNLSVGDKLWVRSASANPVSTGYLALNLVG